MAKLITLHGKGYEKQDIDDPEFLELALVKYREMRHAEAKEFNEASELAQRADAINSALSSVTGLVLRKLAGDDGRVERSLAGDVKKRINTRKKRSIGAVNKTDMNNLKQHYSWLKALEREIIENGLPGWLS